MLWFTFKVTFGTIPGGWLGGKEMIIILPQVQLELELGLELGKRFNVPKIVGPRSRFCAC